ncbi:Protein stn1 [Schizosaccharomyces pombe]
MFISDVHKISFHPHLQRYIGFWMGFPIRWIQIVGYIAAIDIYEGKHVLTVDDCSGTVLRVVFIIQDDFSMSKRAISMSPGNVVCVFGKINSFRSEVELIAQSFEELRDPNDEWKAWQKRMRYKKNLTKISKNHHSIIRTPKKSHFPKDHAKELLKCIRQMCKLNVQAGFTIEELIIYLKAKELHLPLVHIFNVENEIVENCDGNHILALNFSLQTLLQHGRIVRKSNSVYMLVTSKDIIRFVIPLMASGHLEAHKVQSIVRDSNPMFLTLPLSAIAKHICQFLLRTKGKWRQAKKYTWVRDNQFV